tara:strand:+ start:216 stop:449 length:234 start_codon:yes stop_codon:yes gene_type:complete
MINPIIAIIILLVVWIIFASVYADGMLKQPMYKALLSKDDWQDDKTITDQINEYGLIRLALDLIMISPIAIILLIKR